MKAKLTALAVIILIIVGCSKDGEFDTRPALELKDVSATEIPLNGLYRMTFELRDKEGDISDTIYVQKVSYTCTGGVANFIAPYEMPEITEVKDFKADVEVRFSSNQTVDGYLYSGPATGCGVRDDSCYFRFWLKDKAGNVSDTVKSPDIVLYK